MAPRGLEVLPIPIWDGFLLEHSRTAEGIMPRYSTIAMKPPFMWARCSRPRFLANISVGQAFEVLSRVFVLGGKPATGGPVLEKGAELVHLVVFLLVPFLHLGVSSFHCSFGKPLGTPPWSSSVCSMRVLFGPSLWNLLACSILYRRLLPSPSFCAAIPLMLIFVLSNLVAGSLFEPVVWLSLGFSARRDGRIWRGPRSLVCGCLVLSCMQPQWYMAGFDGGAWLLLSMGLCLLQPRLDVTIGRGSYSLARVRLGDVGVVTLRNMPATDISIFVISRAGSGTMALVVFFRGVSLGRGFGAVIELRHDGIVSEISQME